MRMSQSFESHAAPCDACGAWADVTEVHNCLTKPKEDETVIPSLSRMNAQHDPLQKIPTEIVSYIFEHTLDNSTLSIFRSLLRLGKVCRYWRQVAWTTPTLWKTHHFILNPSGDEYEEDDTRISDKFKRRIKIIQDCVSRSGNLPLSISILYVRDGYTIHFPHLVAMRVDALLKEVIVKPAIIQRIVDLNIQLPIEGLTPLNGVRMPNLKTLSFRQFPSANDSGPELNLTQLIPELEKLTVRSDSLLSHLSTISCPKLLHLEARYCNPNHLFRLMRRTPTLRSCACKLRGDIITSTPEPRTVLPQLDHLDFFSRSEFDLTAFFEKFTLPALQYLKIEARFDAHALLSFFKRSPCHINTLHIIKSNISIAELESVLASLPELSHLYIRPSATPSQIFKTIFASSSVTKRLTYLQCHATWKVSDNWSFIHELFQPAVYSRDKKPVHIEFHVKGPPKTLWMPMEVIRLIQELEEQGWKWSISAFVRDFIHDINLVEASLAHHEQSPLALELR